RAATARTAPTGRRRATSSPRMPGGGRWPGALSRAGCRDDADPPPLTAGPRSRERPRGGRRRGRYRSERPLVGDVVRGPLERSGGVADRVVDVVVARGEGVHDLVRMDRHGGGAAEPELGRERTGDADGDLVGGD